MKKIVFLAPYKETADIIERIFREHNEGNWVLKTILAADIKAVRFEDIEADVIIARGLSAGLAAQYTQIPIVELPVSGYDVVKAAMTAQKLYPGQKIGLIGSDNMISGADSLREILGMDVVAARITCEEDAVSVINELNDSEKRTVIGGMASTGLALKNGLNAVFVRSGPEAIFNSLQEAKRVVNIRRQEQARSERFRAIVDYSTEGIIAVNDQGVIEIFNNSARKLTGLSSAVVGDALEDVLPELSLRQTMAAAKAELGEVRALGAQQVVVNSVPIVVDDTTTGAIVTFQPTKSIQELEGKIRKAIHRRGYLAKSTFADVVAESAVMEKLIEMARQCSRVDSNVLITGETGTGKEVFAQSIHNASNRRAESFVALNCATLPESLLESELFGYAEGAFTGAVKGGKAGIFEQAHRGTIFLDEVSEIPPNIQARLLRVLQEREIMRVGDNKIVPIDVRVIAATNKNLREMMVRGTFRSDLYYRLNVLKLYIPPLRERRKDIIPLFDRFMRYYCGRFNLPSGGLGERAQETLLAYLWPGNVRELRNIAERIAATGFVGHIAENDVRNAFEQEFDGPVDDAFTEPLIPLQDRRYLGDKRKLDERLIVKTLEETNYNHGQAAARLGISRTTLWKRLKAAKMVGGVNAAKQY